MLKFITQQFQKHKYGLIGTVTWRKPLLSRVNIKNMAAHLTFANVNNPEAFWNNVVWTDETKVGIFDQNVQCHILSVQTPHINFQAQ